jgi:hypothetical protein
MIDGFLRSRARDGIAATVEALFPENGYGAPDYRTTDLVARLLAYLDELPAKQRHLILLLFIAIELFAFILVPCTCRFSRLPVERREETVRRFRASRFVAIRVIGDALKATTTLIYMSHPAVSEYIGMREREREPADASPRPDALPAAEAAS